MSDIDIERLISDDMLAQPLAARAQLAASTLLESSWCTVEAVRALAEAYVALCDGAGIPGGAGDETHEALLAAARTIAAHEARTI